MLHTLNYSGVFLRYLVGIRVSNVFNQLGNWEKKGVRNTQTEEMRTKESIQSLATSSLSV